MRFALLGDDLELLKLAQAALALGHEIAWLGEADDDSPLRTLAPRATWGEPWEALLNDPQVDAVLVGASSDEMHRAEPLRKLVQEAIPTLVVHPVVPSMLLYYELDMIRREVQGVLQHYVPGSTHPYLDRLAELARSPDDGIGHAEQLVCERGQRERAPAVVLEQFSRDADLMVAVAGNPDRVSALDSGHEAAYANLGVQMSGPSGISQRWSVSPVEDQPGARLVLIGSTGKAVLQMPVHAAWTLIISRAGAQQEQATLEWNGAEAALQYFIVAVTAGDPGRDWERACLTVEIADAAVRSLEKQRTITLHSEEYSEAATFKGMMTSVGCGLILLVLVVMLAAGLLGDILGLPARVVRLWPVLVVIVLGVFLLLQLLPGLVLPKEKPPAAPPEEDASEGKPR